MGPSKSRDVRAPDLLISGWHGHTQARRRRTRSQRRSSGAGFRPSSRPSPGSEDDRLSCACRYELAQDFVSPGMIRPAAGRKISGCDSRVSAARRVAQLARWDRATGHSRLRRPSKWREWVGAGAGRGTHRRLRQRRHTVAREADADPARFHFASAGGDGHQRLIPPRAPTMEGRLREGFPLVRRCRCAPLRR